MALILNIETATHVCSVSLAKNGKPIETRESREDRSHARLLTQFIREILDAQNLVVSSLYGAGISLLGINSLEALCQAVMREHPDECTADTSREILLCPMIDARRMEVYMALYDNSGKTVKETRAVIITPDTFGPYTDRNTVLVFGPGAAKCREVLDHPEIRFIDGVEPSAENMIELSEKAFKNRVFEDVAYFEPFYLKDFIATIPKNKVIRKEN